MTDPLVSRLRKMVGDVVRQDLQRQHARVGDREAEELIDYEMDKLGRELWELLRGFKNEETK